MPSNRVPEQATDIGSQGPEFPLTSCMALNATPPPKVEDVGSKFAFYFNMSWIFEGARRPAKDTKTKGFAA